MSDDDEFLNEALRRLREEPSDLSFSLEAVMLMFGLTADELRAELIAGRLTAIGVPVEGGCDDVKITSDVIMDWMIKPESQKYWRHRLPKGVKVDIPTRH